MAVLRQTLGVVAVLSVVSFSWGQNLVANSGFDTDVAGWAPFAYSSIVWDPLDAGTNPASGSALVTNASPNPTDGTGAFQCVEGITGGQAYHVSADILFPSGQSGSGHADILVQWFDQPGCNAGDFVGLFSSPLTTTSTPGVWYASVGTPEAPASAQSARVRLSINKYAAGGTLDAQFDNVVLEPLLFADGFESSDTSAWSSTVGGT